MTYTKMLWFLILFLLHKPRCSMSQMEKYIVGGVKANILRYPHSAFLEVNCGHHGICGSSIINQRTVLTAAHCFEDCKRNQKVFAYAGNGDLTKVKVVRPLSAIILHSRYDTDNCRNDIALGLTKRAFPFSDTVKRVIIKNSFPMASAQRAGSMAGWGLVDNENISTYLKSVQQFIQPKNICAKIGNLHPGMFCAGKTIKGKEFPAEGDSGSAYVTKDYQQLGLVSFKIDKYPALTVYTNVSYYYSWIQDKSKKLLCNPKESGTVKLN